MDREYLKTEFENLKNSFDVIRATVEKLIVETKYSKGAYFETIPFSYQRHEFSQGKLLENLKRVKTTKNLYEYGFDSNGRIVEVKEGISIENQYYFQFLLHEKEFTKSVLFDNSKDLINVCLYLYDELGRMSKLFSHARRGGREETYIYSENGKLDYVLVKQIGTNGNEVTPFREQFEYDENGSLKRISKNFDNGYSQETFLAK